LDNFAHIGGWIMGIVLGTVFLAGALKDEFGQRFWATYSKPLMIAMFVLAGALWLTGSYDPPCGSRWSERVLINHQMICC